METDRLKLKKRVHEGLEKVGTIKGGRILTEKVSKLAGQGTSPGKVVTDPGVKKTIGNMTKWNNPR